MCTLLTLNICLMCHTQVLNLEMNQIGDAGLTTLAKAVESGALAPGAKVFLGDNNATETAEQAMLDAAEARGLNVYF